MSDSCNSECWLRKQHEETIDKLYDARLKLLERAAALEGALNAILSDIQKTVDTRIDWEGAVSTIVSGAALTKARAALKRK